MVTYKEKLSAICMQLFEFGLQESTKREEEVNQFWECVHEAKNENKQAAMDCIKDFVVYKKKVRLIATSMHLGHLYSCSNI